MGYCAMTLSLLLIVVMDALKFDPITLFFMVILQICYQLSAGTNTFAYIGGVGNESQVSLAHLTIWSFLLIVQTLLMTDGLPIFGNFSFFFISTLLATFFIYFKVKATEGLTQDQIKDLYKSHPSNFYVPLTGGSLVTSGLESQVKSYARGLGATI